MDIVATIVKSFRPKTVKKFRKRFRSQSKRAPLDLKLFELIYSTDQMDDRQLREALGFESNRNAYYQVRNRLKNKLEDFIVEYYAGDNDRFTILRYFMIAQYLFSEDKSATAWHYLDKADQQASDIEDHELQNLIYNEKFNQFYTAPSINLHQLSGRQRENEKKLIEKNDLVRTLAIVRSRLLRTQFSGTDKHMIATLEQVLEESDLFDQEKEGGSFELQYQIMMAVSEIIRYKENNLLLEAYFKQRYEKWLDQGVFDRDNHDRKLYILFRIIVLQTQNKKFDDALNYLEQFKGQLHQYDKAYYNLFIDYYYHLSSAVYSYVGKVDEAVQLLEEALDSIKQRKIRKDVEFVFHLNLAIFYYYQSDYSKAIDEVEYVLGERDYKPYLSDLLFVYTKLLEVLCFYELDDRKYVRYLLKYIKRKLKPLRKLELEDAVDIERAYRFATLLQKMNRNPDYLFSKKGQQLVLGLVKRKSQIGIGDPEHININAWLFSKLRSKDFYPVYLTFLEEPPTQKDVLNCYRVNVG